MNTVPKQGAPECGLYIRIGDVFNFEDLVLKLRQVFFVTTRSDYEKNMHVLEFPSSGADADEVKGLIGYARQNGFVAILRDNAALAKEWSADGVMLSRPEDILPARTILGGDGLIGLNCQADRNLAERALEFGADYADFTGDLNLIAWWATRTDNPSVAVGVNGPMTNDDCGAYVRAGATFIECGDFILNHPKGAMQGTVDMLYAIDLALENRPVN